MQQEKKRQTKPTHKPFALTSAARLHPKARPYHAQVRKGRQRIDPISRPGAVTPRLQAGDLKNAIGFTARHLCNPHEYWEV
jgi:hypothetical protein